MAAGSGDLSRGAKQGARAGTANSSRQELRGKSDSFAKPRGCVDFLELRRGGRFVHFVFVFSLADCASLDACRGKQGYSKGIGFLRSACRCVQLQVGCEESVYN